MFIKLYVTVTRINYNKNPTSHFTCSAYTSKDGKVFEYHFILKTNFCIKLVEIQTFIFYFYSFLNLKVASAFCGQVMIKLTSTLSQIFFFFLLFSLAFFLFLKLARSNVCKITCNTCNKSVSCRNLIKCSLCLTKRHLP